MKDSYITFNMNMSAVGDECTHIYIKDNVTILALGIGKVKELKIPDGVEIIECGVSRLDTDMKDSVLSYVYIPDSVRLIGKSAFSAIFTLRELTGCKNVRALKSNAFWCCDGIDTISMPNCIYVAEEVFYRCYGLQKVELSEGSMIAGGAFKKCVNLKELRGVALASGSAFEDCELLKKLEFTQKDENKLKETHLINEEPDNGVSIANINRIEYWAERANTAKRSIGIITAGYSSPLINSSISHIKIHGTKLIENMWEFNSMLLEEINAPDLESLDLENNREYGYMNRHGTADYPKPNFKVHKLKSIRIEMSYIHMWQMTFEWDKDTNVEITEHYKCAQDLKGHTQYSRRVKAGKKYKVGDLLK